MEELLKYAPVGILLLIGFTIWKCGVWAGATSERLANLEKSVESLKKSVERIEQTVANLPGQIIESLGNLLQGRPGGFSSGNVMKQSPLTLSHKGYELAKKLDAWKTAEKYCDRVMVAEDASPFSIQNRVHGFVFSELMSLVSIEEKRKIEDVAYNDGGTLGDILIIFSVLIRDEIFKKYQIDAPEYETSGTHQVSPSQEGIGLPT